MKTTNKHFYFTNHKTKQEIDIIIEYMYMQNLTGNTRSKVNDFVTMTLHIVMINTLIIAHMSKFIQGF